MDIVSRLKRFINHEAVAVTQFADNCKIPRPTLSQLLNGRNKKVSDELITKIHDAYPRLSVLWLMFGEGNMIAEENTKPSAPQSGSFFTSDSTFNSESEQHVPRIDFEKNFSETESENPEVTSDSLLGLKSTPISLAESSESASSGEPRISFNPYAKKRIVNIIVYYDDNSFESFVPGLKK